MKTTVYAVKVGRRFVAIQHSETHAQYQTPNGPGGHFVARATTKGLAEVRDYAAAYGTTYRTLKQLRADHDDEYCSVVRDADSDRA